MPIYATAAFLLGLAIAVFRGAFTTFYAVDDFVALASAVTPRWPSWIQIFEQRFFSLQGAFTIFGAVFDLRPEPPHMLIFALHVFNAWLVQCLLARLAPRQPAIGRSAGGLFLIHPVAYTPMAWLAAGLGEVPTLTLTLLATLLAARFVAGGSFLNGIGAIVLPFAAAGFKQHAAVAPAYVLGVATYCAFRGRDGRPGVRVIVRIAWVAMPLVAGVVLFARYVLPALARASSNGPYARVLTLESLARTYPLGGRRSALAPVSDPPAHRASSSRANYPARASARIKRSIPFATAGSKGRRSWSRLGYSKRSADNGLRRDAFRAGTTPNRMPTSTETAKATGIATRGTTKGT